MRAKREVTLVLRPQEIARLCEIAEETGGRVGPTLSAMIRLAAFTGMRPGELFALKRGEINRDKSEITVRQLYRSKVHDHVQAQGGRPRLLTLLPEALPALDGIPKRPAGELAFTTPRGSQFTQRNHHFYWDRFRTAFWQGLSSERRAEIPVEDFTFQQLRHVAAVSLLERGAVPGDVATYMGLTDGAGEVVRRYRDYVPPGATSPDAAFDRVRRLILNP